MDLRNSLSALIAFGGLLALTGTAKAQIVYIQPSDFPGGTVYASQNDSASFGNFATVYDNFTLAGDTLITDVHWQGSYFNPGVQGSILSFDLSFWADNAGQPGALLASYPILGTANETLVGSGAFGPVFDYFTLLPSSFTATGGTNYWLSVVPTMSFPPQWGWQTGTGGDGIAVQDFFGSRNRIQADMAFALSGHAAVPEPGSVALLVSMAGTGAGFVLRRRTK
jgi:hypothetical protein